MSESPASVDLETIHEWLAGGFHDVLRMSVASHDPDGQRLTLALPFRPEYARLPSVGDYHGGILAALLDVTGTFTAALAARRIATTVNFRTDYLRPPIGVDLLSTGSVVRAGRSLITCDVAVSDADGREYAIARGTWMPVAPGD